MRVTVGLLALLIAVIGAAVVVVDRTSSQNGALSATDLTTEPQAKAAKTEKAGQAHKRSAALRWPTPTLTVDVPILSPAAPQQPSFLFPSASEISKGVPRSALLARYGRPNLTITWSDSGQMQERYIWMDATKRTDVFLRDGMVQAVQSVNR